MERTFGEAAARWLKSREGTKWAHYDARYVRVLEDYIGATTPLRQVTRGTVADLRDKLLESRKASTVNRYLTTLRTILGKARDDWEWIESAPKIKPLKEEERTNWVTKEQAARLIKELPESRRAPYVFALLTGLRKTNVRLLRWEWVSDDMALLALPGKAPMGLMVPGAEEPEKLVNFMKNGRDLVVPLNSQAQEVLAAQRGKHDEWVFPYKGRPVQELNTRTFRQARERAGVPNCRFHDLRHAWASWLSQDDTPALKLMQLGGWRSVKMVQRYSHLQTEHLATAVESTTFEV